MPIITSHLSVCKIMFSAFIETVFLSINFKFRQKELKHITMAINCLIFLGKGILPGLANAITNPHEIQMPEEKK